MDVLRIAAALASMLAVTTVHVTGNATAASRGATTTSTAQPTRGPTIMAAGDNCDPTPATCMPVGDLVRFYNPDKVLTLGDNQYPEGTLAQFRASYDIAWGSFKWKTLPAIGNHEIKASPTGQGYCDYFGSAANCPTKQYRSDLGTWSVIVLESNGAPSAAELSQFEALLAQANNLGDNVALAFHHPRWSSPCDGCHGSDPKFNSIWTRALSGGVDVILNGHDHKYERFNRMSTTGPSAIGIPQITSGMGGAHPDPGCSSRLPGSARCIGNLDAVLEMTLNHADFAFRYIKADGTPDGAVIDRGTFATR